MIIWPLKPTVVEPGKLQITGAAIVKVLSTAQMEYAARRVRRRGREDSRSDQEVVETRDESHDRCETGHGLPRQAGVVLDLLHTNCPDAKSRRDPWRQASSVRALGNAYLGLTLGQGRSQRDTVQLGRE